MLYQKITTVALTIYAFLSSPTRGATYILSSVGVKTASDNPYTCTSGEICEITCDIERDMKDEKDLLEFHCGSSTDCQFHCEQKKCLSKATIYGENADNLIFNLSSSGQECLKDASVYAPENGNAYFYNGYIAPKGYRGINVYSGTNTQEIIINCDGTSDTDECKGTNVYASSAQFLRINIGSSSQISEFEEATIECPVDSSYDGPEIAPCIIDAANGKLTSIDITAPYGTPKDVYFPNGCSTCKEVWLLCDTVDTLNGGQSEWSKYPFSTSSDCWWTQHPTFDPTAAPTLAPSIAPTTTPTVSTADPTNAPSLSPSRAPSIAPSLAPTLAPTSAPTIAPSNAPSRAPSIAPTNAPSSEPSTAPSTAPTRAPTVFPTIAPSNAPSLAPSIAPTSPPTNAPSSAPSSPPTATPSLFPTSAPSFAPTGATISPTFAPTNAPSLAPSNAPSRAPSNAPSFAPSLAPSNAPSFTPSNAPSFAPSEVTESPTLDPTAAPSLAPTMAPTPTWSMCTDDAECKYIAEITFYMSWQADKGFFDYLSTIMQVEKIAHNIVDEELIQYVKEDNILLSDTTSNTEKEIDVELIAMVGTNDASDFDGLLTEIRDTDDVIERILIQLADAIQSAFPDVTFGFFDGSETIEQIKPKPKGAKMGNGPSGITIVIIVGCVAFVVVLIITVWGCIKYKPCKGIKGSIPRLRSNSVELQDNVWLPKSYETNNNKAAHVVSDSGVGSADGLNWNVNDAPGRARQDTMDIDL